QRLERGEHVVAEAIFALPIGAPQPIVAAPTEMFREMTVQARVNRADWRIGLYVQGNVHVNPLQSRLTYFSDGPIMFNRGERIVKMMQQTLPLLVLWRSSKPNSV